MKMNAPHMGIALTIEVGDSVNLRIRRAGHLGS